MASIILKSKNSFDLMNRLVISLSPSIGKRVMSTTSSDSKQLTTTNKKYEWELIDQKTHTGQVWTH